METCKACSHCYMEPSDDQFICGHPDAGTFGTYVHHAVAKDGHCGPELPKFKQHPHRTPDGLLRP